MKNLLEFLGALNWQFVVLFLVFWVGLGLFYVATLVSRASKRHERVMHEERMEQKRVDAARGIVPVRNRDAD